MYSIININKIFKLLIQKINFDFGKTNVKLGNLTEFKNYRDFGYTTVEKYPEIVISPKLRFQELSVIKAILMHEIAHFILITQKKKHSERETDGGLPAGGIVSSILLISGDSGNLTKSGKKITNFEINGSSVLPF